jgi:hypothetical protein
MVSKVKRHQLLMVLQIDGSGSGGHFSDRSDRNR